MQNIPSLTRVRLKLWLRDMGQRITLVPYGSNLLTPGASFWVFAAAIAIFIMASAEAISWAYLGSFLASGKLGNVTGLITGLFIFMVVWIVDSSFVTLDLSRSFYERELSVGREEEGQASLKDNLKLATGLFGRVVIILVTLYVASPFLSQLVFRSDIDAVLRQEEAQQVLEVRDSIAASFENRIQRVQLSRDSLQQAVILESQGIEGSGRYGRGEAVQTIENVINEKEEELSQLVEARDNTLSMFDNASEEELQRKYGIDLQAAGIQQRSEALRTVKENPDYETADLAVKAFLGFLFLAIIILKLFSPRSIRVYYNEQLQDLFAQYRAGLFNSLLSERERSSGGTPRMSPLRFEDWCLNTYRLLKLQDQIQRQRGLIKANRDSQLSDLRGMISSASDDLEPLVTQHNNKIERLQTLNTDIVRVEKEIEVTERKLSAKNDAIGEMGEQMSAGSLDGQTFAEAARIRTRLLQDVELLEDQLQTLEVELTTLRLGKERAERERVSLERRMDDAEDLVQRLSAMLQEEQEKMAEELAAVAGSGEFRTVNA